MENVLDFGILQNVYSLTVPRIIDQFGRKMCQKKRKDLDYKLLFQKRFVVHERPAVKNLFINTYDPGSLF